MDVLFAEGRGGAHVPRPDPMEQALDAMRDDLRRFEQELANALAPQAKYLTATEFGIYERGKKLRPLMLMLAARLALGDADLPLKVVKAAASLEMLHVASLIHDDIIDNALVRRGLESVNAARGVNTAILVGDLQFLQAIRNFIDAIETDSEMGLVKVVLDSAFNVCVGELDEISADPTWSIARLKTHYMEVIERKTALMFGLACETGQVLAGASSSDARRLGFYGRRIGRAFQIMDDILDFMQPEQGSGKAVGIDLAQGRLTLPTIYAMEALPAQHPVCRHLRREQPLRQPLAIALDAIRATDALGRAYADARREALDALNYLKHFKPSRYRDHLEGIAMHIVDRQF
jgi:heptaprenyl diphosphate synthase